jgi:hypothetical protein
LSFPLGNIQNPTAKEEILRENVKPFGNRHFISGKPESLQEISKVDRSWLIQCYNGPFQPNIHVFLPDFGPLQADFSSKQADIG